MTVLRALARVTICCLAACGGPAPAPSFTLAAHDETAALLSVWGSSASDVWMVGGAHDATSSPIVLHLQNGAWSQLDTGLTGIDLWWVYGFAGGDVFMSGSSGTIVRYHAGAFEQMTTPAAAGIVFGMWGADPSDLWAVGRAGSAGGAILWHFDGMTWSNVAPPSTLPPGDLAFKVNGRSGNDVWIACSAGGTLHWTGAPPLTYVPTGDPANLFSIVTTASDVVTAGDVTQAGDGALFENDGSGWAAASLAVPLAWRGVGAGNGEVFVVGDQGVIGKRDVTGAWSILKQSLIQISFHAAWIDPDGGFWGVGGDFQSAPTKDGYLLYYGTHTVPPT